MRRSAAGILLFRVPQVRSDLISYVRFYYADDAHCIRGALQPPAALTHYLKPAMFLIKTTYLCIVIRKCKPDWEPRQRIPNIALNIEKIVQYVREPVP